MRLSVQPAGPLHEFRAVEVQNPRLGTDEVADVVLITRVDPEMYAKKLEKWGERVVREKLKYTKLTEKTKQNTNAPDGKVGVVHGLHHIGDGGGRATNVHAIGTHRPR